MWDNALFDAAFDAAGLREEVIPFKHEMAWPAFRARFDQPQRIMLDDQIHTTDYSIEYATGDYPGLRVNDILEIRHMRYRVKQPPVLQGDGYYSIAELEAE